jgi:hypothetical protein
LAASETGNIDVVRMLLKKKPKECYIKSFLRAVSRGHFEVGIEHLDQFDENAFGGKWATTRALVEEHWYVRKWAERHYENLKRNRIDKNDIILKPPANAAKAYRY